MLNSYSHSNSTSNASVNNDIKTINYNFTPLKKTKATNLFKKIKLTSEEFKTMTSRKPYLVLKSNYDLDLFYEEVSCAITIANISIVQILQVNELDVLVEYEELYTSKEEFKIPAKIEFDSWHGRRAVIPPFAQILSDFYDKRELEEI